MKTRYVLGAVLALAIVVIGTAAFTLQNNSTAGNYAGGSSAATSTTPSTDSTGSSQTGSGQTTSTAQTYTMAQVAQHNNASSCWSAINGNVYDLTSWINQHPGGAERILSICGSDGSSAFNGQHGGQSQPMQILQSFYIGTLAS